jgi:hypothetical protein
MGRFKAFAALLCAVATLTGCGFSNLAFVADHRLHFVEPKSRALVTAPVTLRWTMVDFAIATPGHARPTSKAGYFAIFVDRAPIKPGQNLSSVASGDKSCLRAAGCPDAQYLADRQIYTTTQMSFVLQQVTPFHSRQKTQTHQAIIVLLDASGRRIGEAAWYRDFRIKQRILY